jgi:hypothetical protein
MELDDGRQNISTDAIRERFREASLRIEELAGRFQALGTLREQTEAQASTLQEAAASLTALGESIHELLTEATAAQAAARSAIEEAGRSARAEEIAALRTEVTQLRDVVETQLGGRLRQIDENVIRISRSLPKRWISRTKS